MLMSPTFPVCSIAPDASSSSMDVFLAASDFIWGDIFLLNKHISE